MLPGGQGADGEKQHIQSKEVREKGAKMTQTGKNGASVGQTNVRRLFLCF